MRTASAYHGPRSDFQHIDIIVHSAANYVRGPFASAPIFPRTPIWINVLAPYALAVPGFTADATAARAWADCFRQL